MITNTISSNQTSQYSLDHSGQKWVLKDGVSITSATSGIFEDDNLKDNIIVVNGDITATGFNQAAVNSYGDNTQITLAKTGHIDGYYGIRTGGANANVINNGRIDADQDGIYGTLADATIVNNNTIVAGGAGIKVGSGEFRITNAGDMSGYYGIRVVNSDVTATLEKGGSIDASVHAISVVSMTGDSAFFTNNGSLSASKTYWAFWGEDGNERFVNNGSAAGNISMGAGNDRFVNHGTLTEAKVELGAGNDLYDIRGGKFAGNVYGGVGNDTYIVDRDTVKLNEYQDGGNDTIRSTASFSLSDEVQVETIRLIGNGSVDADGNLFANKLYGNAGNNDLTGRAGEDLLSGGKGRDILSGGSDTDTFVFKTGFGQDIVKDFVSGQDHIDLSGAGKISSFNDLLQNHITVSGDDLVIHNGNDTLTLRDVEKADLNMSDFLF